MRLEGRLTAGSEHEHARARNAARTRAPVAGGSAAGVEEAIEL